VAGSSANDAGSLGCCLDCSRLAFGWLLLHFVHHLHGDSNFAVIDFFWNRVLGANRNPNRTFSEGPTVSRPASKMACKSCDCCRPTWHDMLIHAEGMVLRQQPAGRSVVLLSGVRLIARVQQPRAKAATDPDLDPGQHRGEVGFTDPVAIHRALRLTADDFPGCRPASIS
jgi:hypothetical protein